MNAVPAPDRSWFTEARFGMFIHWGLYALPARHEWVQNYERIGKEEYRRYFERFDPKLYDPREWAAQAKRAGMRYAILTTKHHEGFCLWDSAHTEFKATRTPAGRDLLRPFVDAFREAGLRVGFYYSLLDWDHPHYTVDRMHPLTPRSEDPEDFAALNEGRDMRVYAAYMRDQVTELLTQYGPIDLLWFDMCFPTKWKWSEVAEWEKKHGPGPGKGPDDWESEELLALVRRLQPHALLNDRLGIPGAGNFTTPEQYQPEKPLRDRDGNLAVWEACHTFSGSWSYHRDELTWKSVPLLLRMLIDNVSKGGNLLLNVGPTARGEFDPRAREALAGIGEWMRHHGDAIYGCGIAPEGFTAPPDTRLTYNAATDRLYLHLFDWPFRYVRFEGLRDRIAYAQFLHDGSEVPLRPRPGREEPMLHLPDVKPWPEVPVIELFLR
jgi:alpha-L-fucosidase